MVSQMQYYLFVSIYVLFLINKYCYLVVPCFFLCFLYYVCTVFSFIASLFDDSVWRQIPFTYFFSAVKNFCIFEEVYKLVCGSVYILTEYYFCFKVVGIKFTFSQIIEVWKISQNVVGCFKTVYLPILVTVFHYFCTIFTVRVVSDSGHVKVAIVMVS